MLQKLRKPDSDTKIPYKCPKCLKECLGADERNKKNTNSKRKNKLFKKIVKSLKKN